MNRRTFVKTAGATGTLLCVAPPAVLFEGCTDSSVISLINVALTAAEKVLAVAEAGATWVESFKTAINALKTSEAAWQTGSSVQIVIDALNTITNVLAVIPITAVYSPLIDILVAGIEAILQALPQSTTAKLSQNQHFGRATLNKPHIFQNKTSAFKEQWNRAVAANPALAAAKL